MSAGEEPEDDYEPVDHGDPNVPSITIKSSDLLAALKNPRMGVATGSAPPVRPRYTNPPENGAPPVPMVKRTGVAGKAAVPLPARGPPPEGAAAAMHKNYELQRKNYETRIKANKLESSHETRIKANKLESSLTNYPRHTLPHTSPVSHVPPPPPQPPAMEEGETLMLSELVRKYSKSLPLRVRVDEGFCGSEERFVISSGDIYNFHFLKNERVVSIQDCGGNSFPIPLHSPIKFSLIYNPNNDFQEAMKGLQFSSVSELLQSKNVPKVVKVVSCQQPQLSDGKKLEVDEVLLVRKVGKTMLRKPFLKVFSATKKEEKSINDDCGATFVTTPTQVQVHLIEIIEVFSEGLPLDAMLYPPDDEEMDDLPPHLITDKVTITHTSIESAVIATTCWDDDTEVPSEDDTLPVSIPIEMEIEVTVMYVDEDDLYQTTKMFLNNFDLSRIKDMKEATKSGQTMARQNSKICKRVRQGYEYRGMDFTMSDKVYRGQEAIPSSLPFRSALSQPLPPIPGEATSAVVKPVIQPPSQAPPTIPARGTKNYPEVKLKPKPENKLPSQPTINKLPSQPPVNKLPSQPPLVRSKSPAVGGGTATENMLAAIIARTTPKNPPPDGGADTIYTNQSALKALPPRKTSNPPPPPVAAKTPPTPTKSPPIAAKNPPVTAKTVPVAAKTVPVANANEDVVASDKEVAELRLGVTSLTTLVNAMKEDTQQQMRSMKEEMGRLSRAMEGLRTDYMALKKDMARMRGQAASPEKNASKISVITPTSNIAALSPEQERDNLVALRALSNYEVLSLLEAMKLPMYKEGFSEETIDGEVLAECDEHILESELGVVNKLHRMRLMKLISGRHSAHYYFTEGLNPYGQFAAPS